MNTPDEVSGREFLSATVESMNRELETGTEWENNSLERFLDAFSALLMEIDDAYVNEGKTAPTDPWVIVAEVFRGARNYE